MEKKNSVFYTFPEISKKYLEVSNELHRGALPSSWKNCYKDEEIYKNN